MSAKAAGRKPATPAEPAAANRSAQKPAAKSARSSAKSAATPSRTKSAHKKQAPAPAATPAELSHRLHLLLHTIHQIERYEERLCSMQDAIKRTGKLSAPMLRDLQALLDEIPSDDYQHDLDAVRSALPA